MSVPRRFFSPKRFFYVYSQYTFIKTRWGSLEHTLMNWCPKCTGTGGGFDFNSPKDLVGKLTGKQFRYLEHISWEAIGIWPRMHFPGQRLMHRLQSIVIFHIMLRLKFLFDELAERYIILIFTHLY